jgi:hypothetical protein
MSKVVLDPFLLLAVFDGYNHVVVHALQKHLALEFDDPALLRTLESSNESFVVILGLVVIKEFSKLDMGCPGFVSDAFNIQNELRDLIFNAFLKYIGNVSTL